MTPIHLFYFAECNIILLFNTLNAFVCPSHSNNGNTISKFLFHTICILEEIICSLYYVIMIFFLTFSHRIAKLSSYFIIVFNLFTFVLNLCSLNQLCSLYTRATFTQRVAVDHKLNKYHLDRSKELKFSLE